MIIEEIQSGESNVEVDGWLGNPLPEKKLESREIKALYKRNWIKMYSVSYDYWKVYDKKSYWTGFS